MFSVLSRLKITGGHSLTIDSCKGTVKYFKIYSPIIKCRYILHSQHSLQYMFVYGCIMNEKCTVSKLIIYIYYVCFDNLILN